MNLQIGQAESLLPPPVEKVKPPAKKKKKRILRKKKRKLFKRNTQNRKAKALQEQQEGKPFPAELFYYLQLGGVIAFGVGVALLNPVLLLVGALCVLIGYLVVVPNYLSDRHWTEGLGLWFLAGLYGLIGLASFIVGLVIGIPALWIAGLVFFLAFVVWMVVLLFFL